MKLFTRLSIAIALVAMTMFLASCDSGSGDSYKTGGGGKPQHFDPSTGQYD